MQTTFKKKIIIIHQEDLFGNKVSGILSFIREFIRFAPPELEISYIGVTSNNADRPVKKWMDTNLGKKKVKFLPLIHVKDENKKSKLPLSARFSFQLFLLNKKTFNDCTLFFHRMEPIAVLKKIKCPKIYLNHTDIEKQILSKTTEQLWNKFPGIYLKLESKLIPIIDKLYTISEDSLKYYENNYPQFKYKFAYQSTCIDTSIFFPSKESSSSQKKSLIKKWPYLSHKAKWIIFTGRLQEAKAPDKLIKVFKMALNIFPLLNLIMIGEGNLLHTLKNNIKGLDIESKAFLLGSLPQYEIANFLRASDVFLLTSNSEGMPISVLESLACGTPVVSTNVGDVSKVIKKSYSGEVSSLSSEEQINKSLLKVLNKPEIYTTENCVSSISNYSSKKALKSIYDTCLTL